MEEETFEEKVARAEAHYDWLKDKVHEQYMEIERLNNIINELEKELKEDYKIWMCNSRSNGKSVEFGIEVCKTHFYNRLQELKDSDKE